MSKVLGFIDPVWRGVPLAIIEGSGKVKLGGVVNEAVVYGRRVGRAEKFEASEIEAKLAVEAGQSLLDLFAAGEGELVVLLDTGQTYTWPDAFITARPDPSQSKGGDMTIKWSAGQPAEVL